MTTVETVLIEAISIIEQESPLPECENGGGMFCPYCAIAKAKTKLDEGDEEAPGMLALISNPLGGLAHDIPLEQARGILKKLRFPEIPNKDESLAALKSALEKTGGGK